MHALIRINSFSRFSKFMPADSSDLRLRRLFGSGAALGHGLVELGLVLAIRKREKMLESENA